MKEHELPDFNDLIKIADDIADAKRRLAFNKAIVDDRLAEITEDVLKNEVYWTRDKAPSMVQIRSTYYVRGRNEEERKWLMEHRLQISNDEAFIKNKEMIYNIQRDLIDVWRTHRADQRGAYFEG